METQPLQMIGVGSPVVDLVAEIEEDLLQTVAGEKGGMQLVDSTTLQSLVQQMNGRTVTAPGGSAGNTTFALTRLGMRCAFLGKVGHDANGTYYRRLFRKIGGECSRFKTDGCKPTACCLSLVTPDSERTMRTDLGAAADFSPADIRAEDFRGCRHVHVEGYLLFNRELLAAVLEAARSQHCTVSLDLGSFEVVESSRDILPEILEKFVDIVFANESEAAAFCGAEDARAGLETLGRHCPVAAVKIGAQGAWLKDSEGAIHVPALVAGNPVDTTGAGDYWAAGFLFGHLNHYPLLHCGRLGALLSSHVVRHMGAALPESAWNRIILETTTILMTEAPAADPDTFGTTVQNVPRQ